MSSKSCLRLAVGLILVSVVIMLFACGAFYWFFASWTDSPSPTEVIREQTEQLLQAARIGPNDPVPTEMADYRRYERQLCGNLLTELLKRNKNQYLINVVGVWGDYASPKPWGTGATEATIDVLFPDGTRVRFGYYSYFFESCQEQIVF